MNELDNLAVQGTPLRHRPPRRRARADDAVAQPARVQPLGDHRPEGARQRLGDRPQRRCEGPRRDQAARQVVEEGLLDRPTTSRSSSATSTTRGARSRSTRARPRTPAARRRPATPAWRASSTTSTTRPVRSTSTTRSATSCTSRSSRSAPGPAPTTTRACTRTRSAFQRRRLGRDHERPRRQPLRRLARRQPARHQRAAQPAALRPRRSAPTARPTPASAIPPGTLSASVDREELEARPRSGGGPGRRRRHRRRGGGDDGDRRRRRRRRRDRHRSGDPGCSRRRRRRRPRRRRPPQRTRVRLGRRQQRHPRIPLRQLMAAPAEDKPRSQPSRHRRRSSARSRR